MLPFAGSPDMWSQKLGRWLRANGFADARLVVHSLRSYKDALRRGRVREDVARAIMGHSDGSVASQYGSGHSLDVLRDAVEKVTY